MSVLGRFEEAVKYEGSKNTKFQAIKIVTITLVTKSKKLDFKKVDDNYIYLKTSHKVTWYITGLPNGTSLRP